MFVESSYALHYAVYAHENHLHSSPKKLDI